MAAVPYGIRPRNLRINGVQAKGYLEEDMIETVRRYVPRAEAEALLDELRPVPEQAPRNPLANGHTANGKTV